MFCSNLIGAPCVPVRGSIRPFVLVESKQRDAERAVAECPGPMAQEQLKRSQEYQRVRGRHEERMSGVPDGRVYDSRHVGSRASATTSPVPSRSEVIDQFERTSSLRCHAR